MSKNDIERILERCLRRGVHTGEGRELPRRFKGRADELGRLLEVAHAASRAYADVPEPPQQLNPGRVRLFSAAAQRRERTTPASQSRKVTRSKRMTGAFLGKLAGATLAAMIATLAVGGGAAVAAADSLPGEALYPVKLTVEDIRLALAGSPEAESELAMELVQERTQEMEQLMAQGEEIPDDVVARMERHLNRAMSQAAWTSEDEMPGLLQRMATRLQDESETLEQLRIRAQEQEQNQTQLQTAQQACDQAQQQASEGAGDPQLFRERHQDRDGMPDDVSPPDTPSNDPNQGEGGNGPGGPGNGQGGSGNGGGQSGD